MVEPPSTKQLSLTWMDIHIQANKAPVLGRNFVKLCGRHPGPADPASDR